MKDWAQNAPRLEDIYAYIDLLKAKRDCAGIYENKRYAIALKETGELIGMAGMGLEGMLNEIEIAYFMSEGFQRRGYTKKAVQALVQWRFKNSDAPYLS